MASSKTELSETDPSGEKLLLDESSYPATPQVEEDGKLFLKACGAHELSEAEKRVAREAASKLDVPNYGYVAAPKGESSSEEEGGCELLIVKHAGHQIIATFLAVWPGRWERELFCPRCGKKDFPRRAPTGKFTSGEWNPRAGSYERETDLKGYRCAGCSYQWQAVGEGLEAPVFRLPLV